MPKIIELTVELEIQKVTCPGVWLCQDGRVSLTIFLLGTSYQTCMLPPIFPLMFKDIFYFRKNFQESCALNNICCILKDETIYCELVQWTDDCNLGECTVLAQYLGALNDVLFPPNMCSNDGVDLLMRRSKEFPGILSPKIEIATKVRIDEVWDQPSNVKPAKVSSCHCSRDPNGARQGQVCHSAQYHRSKCNKRVPSMTRSRSHSHSRSQGTTRSCCSLTPEPETKVICGCPKHTSSPSPTKSRASLCKNPKKSSHHRKCQYDVYNVETLVGGIWPTEEQTSEFSDHEDESKRFHTELNQYKTIPISLTDENRIHKQQLESRYIDHEPMYESKLKERDMKKHIRTHLTPCVCEICRRYHELFHTNGYKS